MSDTSLGRTLRNWSSRKKVPGDGRARLLHMAFHIQQSELLDKQNSKDFPIPLNKGGRIGLAQAGRWDAIWNLYDRYELTISRIV